ncbi:MAG: SDR family NAD(P)-dependent oxidoreductase [Anaerolineae bacterium]|jgi:nucleoside-diphosphate-sugar epimerase|nr:SDR family NAD(P)-dependent oxidoreductase [Anaerolineae bacterium]
MSAAGKGAILVTGAAGFIGSRVCRFLLQDGREVIGIDNLNDAYDTRLKYWRLEQLQSMPGFTFHQLDITDLYGMENALGAAGIESVINLAARAGVRASLDNPWLFVDTNLTGTLNLLELCHRHGIEKFILASTSSIYGKDAPQPTPEDADSSKPLQPYAASKKSAEAMAHAYHYLYGIDVSVVRYFTVYGPAGRPDMVMFRFCQWIAEGRTVHLNGDGSQSRGFTYVDDIARGTIQALRPLGYEIINLGGHEVMSINDMIAALESMLGQKAHVERHPFHKADMLSNWADVGKACRLLGWQPQVGLQEGMQQLVDWYLAERTWASQVLTP